MLKEKSNNPKINLLQFNPQVRKLINQIALFISLNHRRGQLQVLLKSLMVLTKLPILQKSPLLPQLQPILLLKNKQEHLAKSQQKTLFNYNLLRLLNLIIQYRPNNHLKLLRVHNCIINNLLRLTVSQQHNWIWQYWRINKGKNYCKKKL